MKRYSNKVLAKILDQDIFHQIGDAADQRGVPCYVVGEYVRDVFLECADGDFDVVEENLMEELERRDFTINSMAISLNGVNFGELVDPFKGLDDLEDGFVNTVFNPLGVFGDDPLCMMRCIRLATQLNFRIEDETFEAIEDMADCIKEVSGEEVGAELNKIIMSTHPSKGFVELQRSGLLNIILPELAALDIVEQKDGRKHKNNFYHTLEVLENIVKTHPQPLPVREGSDYPVGEKEGNEVSTFYTTLARPRPSGGSQARAGRFITIII